MNFIRILSIMLFLIVFSFVYAFLPIQVSLSPESNYLVHKEQFFTWGFAMFFIMNVVAWLLLKLSQPQMEEKRGESIAAWYGGLPFVLNISFILVIGFIGVLNNPTHISASNYAYLNFMVPVIMFAWGIGFIYLMLTKKRTS